MLNRIMPCVALGVLAALSGCNQNNSQTTDSGGTSSATTSSTTSGKKPKVVYLTNGVASFWVIAEAGAKAGGEKFNADVSVLMPADITEQKRMVEDSITRGVDGIAISPIDPDNQTPLIDQAAESHQSYYARFRRAEKQASLLHRHGQLHRRTNVRQTRQRSVTQRRQISGFHWPFRAR